MMGQLKVTLERSLSGKTPNQRKNARGLGLRKRHQTVVLEDTPAIRGMLDKVAHMVRIEELED